MANQPRNRFTKIDREPKKPKGESLTQQQFKEDSDINTIVARARRTGILGDPNAPRKPMFGDYSNSASFLEMRNYIATANQRFEALPAKLRRRSGNDPLQVVRFVEDPENKEEAIALGLLPKPVPGEPVPNLPSPGILPAAKADPEANPRLDPKKDA